MIEEIERPFCPDPQVLGAFVEGTLATSQLAGVRDHLATCNDCLDEVGDAAEQFRSAPVAFPRRTRVTWLSVAAGIATAVISAGYWFVQRDPVDVLRAVKMRERHVEPRLSGFRFAEYRRYRGPQENENLALTAAVLNIQGKYGESHSAKAKHAVGLSYLLEEEERQKKQPLAVQELAAAVKAAPNDPAILNDYAAALWTAAEQNDDAQMRLQALAAVDGALRIRPNFPEALYNRALFLAELNRPDAPAAWQAYLHVDPNPKSPWVDEFVSIHSEP